MVFDTIIIGAGIAGLQAGHILTKAGHRVCILEARDRIGGRIYTLSKEGLDAPVELGAEFVHGLPLEIQRWVDRDRDLIQREGEYLVADRNGLRATGAPFAKLRAIMDQLPNVTGRDVSFAAFLATLKPPPDAETLLLAKNYVEGYHAADTSQISAKVLGVVEKEGKDAHAVEGAFLFKDGWKVLVDRLAEPLGTVIRLNHVVTSVAWKEHEVSVDIRVGNQRSTLEARSVLITVPVGVLNAMADQPGAIRFSPKLPPSKLAALAKIRMGHAVRMVFQLKEAFWERNEATRNISFLFDNHPQTKLRTWWVRDRLLVGWIGGPDVHLWSDESERTRQRVGVEAITRIFSLPEEQVNSLLEQTYFYDWSADPYARGVYNYVAVDGTAAQEALAEPVADTLFFAGEATQPGGYSGTANGAIISGARVAKEILESFH